MPGEGTRQMEVARLLLPGPCLTTQQLADASGLSRREVAKATCALIYRGWLDRLERGCVTLSAEGRRALGAGETITSGPFRPLTQQARRRRQRTGRDKMWAAMRTASGQKFDFARLEQLAGATPAAARRFVAALARTGYLAELRRQPGEALTSNGFKRFLLVDDTGPATPILKREGVWDANRSELRRFPA